MNTNRLGVGIYLIIALLLFTFSACTQARVDQSTPEQVVQQFIAGQASNNKRLINALLTAELRSRFKEQKLYLGDRFSLKNGKVTSSEVHVAWDEPDKKVYQINYIVEYTSAEETKTLHLREAVSLLPREQKWFINEYAHEKK